MTRTFHSRVRCEPNNDLDACDPSPRLGEPLQPRAPVRCHPHPGRLRQGLEEPVTRHPPVAMQDVVNLTLGGGGDTR